MRKLPNGKYMYDEDPPGSNEFGYLILKIGYVVVMCMSALFLALEMRENGISGIAEVFKSPVMIGLFFLFMTLHAFRKLWALHHARKTR